MSATIFTGKDGSRSLYSDIYGEQYHSVNGPLTESEHIFIQNGLMHSDKNPLRIFEMGFGTGLNAMLSLKKAMQFPDIYIEYTGLEKHPVDAETAKKLKYPELCNIPTDIFEKMHCADHVASTSLTENFKFEKIKGDLLNFSTEKEFDIIYFDAFSPENQPELWTSEIFSYLYQHLSSGGLLLTYSAKGIVKQALRAAGFRIERLSGPPGKRHILRAVS